MGPLGSSSESSILSLPLRFERFLPTFLVEVEVAASTITSLKYWLMYRAIFSGQALQIVLAMLYAGGKSFKTNFNCLSSSADCNPFFLFFTEDAFETRGSARRNWATMTSVTSADNVADSSTIISRIEVILISTLLPSCSPLEALEELVNMSKNDVKRCWISSSEDGISVRRTTLLTCANDSRTCKCWLL